jgi:hypothetical protein
MITEKRITAWMPQNLVDAVDRVNQEIEKRYGIKISLADAQRMMCVVYARTALTVLEGQQMLSAGELEQAFCALLSKKKEREE